jgi:cytoskeletal protein CcmA (bactofilin family)
MSERKTEIGAKTTITGSVDADEDLVVRGRVDGTIRLTKTLLVEPDGVVVADIAVKDCQLSGTVVGNVVAADVVRIVEGGRMVGDIRAPRFVLAPGATYRGNVDMGNLEESGARANSGRPAAQGSAKSAEGRGQTKLAAPPPLVNNRPAPKQP